MKYGFMGSSMVIFRAILSALWIKPLNYSISTILKIELLEPHKKKLGFIHQDRHQSHLVKDANCNLN